MKLEGKPAFPLDLSTLGSEVGSMLSYSLPFSSDEAIGTEWMVLPAGQEHTYEVLAVATPEGVSVSLQGQAHLEGQCVRCLEKAEQDVQLNLTRMYYYPDVFAKLVAEMDGQDGTGESEIDIESWDEMDEGFDERFQMLGNSLIDLEPLLIEALVPQIPYNVVCSEQCEGLCEGCGLPLSSLPADHDHEAPLVSADSPFSALLSSLGQLGITEDEIREMRDRDQQEN